MRIIPAYRSQIGAGSGGGTGGSDPFLPEYGANLIWVTGLTYEVVPIQSTIQYYIQGTLYSSTGGQGTSATADATNDRFDAYVLDTNGNVVVIEGTPAANPVLPAIDPAQYALVAYVRISAASTSAGDDGDVDQICIYQENAEWTTSSSSTTPTDVDFDATTDPQNGTKHIQVNCDISGWKTMKFVKGSGTLNRYDLTVLKWAIKGSAAGSDSRGRIFIMLYNGSTPVAYTAINAGQYGWDQNDTTYHNVALDVNDDLIWLSAGYDTFDTVYLYLRDVQDHTPNSYYIDDICFQYVGNGLNTADCCGHLYGNVLYVDAVDGNDTTAVKGNFNKPYKTLRGAYDNAQSGDLVDVVRGPVVQVLDLRDGIDIRLRGQVEWQNPSIDYLFTDNNSTVNTNIFGDGKIVLGESRLGYVSSQSRINIDISAIELDLSSFYAYLQLDNSVVNINVQELIQTGSEQIFIVLGSASESPRFNLTAQVIESSGGVLDVRDNAQATIAYNNLIYDSSSFEFVRNEASELLVYGMLSEDTATNSKPFATTFGGISAAYTEWHGHVNIYGTASAFTLTTGSCTFEHVGVCEIKNSSNAAAIVRFSGSSTNSIFRARQSALIHQGTAATAHAISTNMNSASGQANVELHDCKITLNSTAIGAGAKAIAASGTLNYAIFGYLSTNGPIDGTNIAEYTMGTPEYDNGNSSTALTINLLKSNAHKVTLTGNCTFTLSNPQAGHTYVLRLVQDGTGSRTVTWPAAVKWEGGTAPTLSTAASAIDLVTLYYDGTNYYGVSALDFS